MTVSEVIEILGVATDDPSTSLGQVRPDVVEVIRVRLRSYKPEAPAIESLLAELAEFRRRSSRVPSADADDPGQEIQHGIALLLDAASEVDWKQRVHRERRAA